MLFNTKEILSVSLILFSVIDILGCLPIIIDIRKRTGLIASEKATIIAGVLMLAFLFFGKSILSVFGLDIESFALAGAVVMFLIGMEMVLGIHIFKPDADGDSSTSSSIVPLAFPLIAGAGTMTTLVSLSAEYEQNNILVAIVLNLIFVYVVLRTTAWFEKKLGKSGTNVLRKIFGIILLAIAIKLFKTHIPA
ncbi:MAG: MarC family protein [Cytophagales bacterium]|nr:MAG: MarC family protein [Cytophagales bacterium]TAF60095.1 MAG: MarC family protein [Cytophagales bacterium]